MDCILHMEQWILSEGIATPEELDAIKERCKTSVRSARDHAWNKHLAPVHVRNQALKAILKDIPEHDASVTALVKKISEHGQHLLGETLSVARRIRWQIGFLGAAPWLRCVARGVLKTFAPKGARASILRVRR